jgi:hypothetical protein
VAGAHVLIEEGGEKGEEEGVDGTGFVPAFSGGTMEGVLFSSIRRIWGDCAFNDEINRWFSTPSK